MSQQVQLHTIRTIDRVIKDPARVIEHLRPLLPRATDEMVQPVDRHELKLAALEKITDKKIRSGLTDKDVTDLALRFTLLIADMERGQFSQLKLAEIIALATTFNGMGLHGLPDIPVSRSGRARSLIARNWLRRLLQAYAYYDASHETAIRQGIVMALFQVCGLSHYITSHHMNDEIHRRIEEIQRETPFWLGAVLVETRRAATMRLEGKHPYYGDLPAMASREHYRYMRAEFGYGDEMTWDVASSGKIGVLIAAVQRWLARGDKYERVSMIRALMRAGFVAHPLLPTLSDLTEDPRAESRIRDDAARSIRYIRTDVVRRVDEVMCAIARMPPDQAVITYALDELASYGPLAAHAIPALEELAPAQGVHVFHGVRPSQLVRTITAIRPVH